MSEMMMGRGKAKKQKQDPRGPLQRAYDHGEAQKVAAQAPTNEQQQRGAYIRGHGRYRRVAVIDVLRDRGDLDDRRHRALAHYRDQAHLAQRSPVKSCLDDSRGGGDLPLPKAVLSAQLETARMERDLGQLVDLARAVAVDDTSLSEWAISRTGGRERLDDKGKVVAIVAVDHERVEAMALMELKMAADRISSR